ncbi:MAG: PQQ-like beta-propeller repeat protein [Deltaproteobacteria bacterium]|nr:PQQ-like beta-propeller repeat protein [Deltaproteobacteria bacterium]
MITSLAVANTSKAEVANQQIDWPTSRSNAAGSATLELKIANKLRAQQWTFNGSGRVYGYSPGMTVWSPPAIGLVDNQAVVFVGSYDKNIYALDAQTGNELWRVTTGDGVYATPVLWQGSNGSQLYVSSSDRLLYALNASNGARLWIHSVADYRPTLGGARLGSVCQGKVFHEAAVFLPYWVWDRSLAANQQESGVTALSASDGKVLWKSRIGDNELTAATCVTIDTEAFVYVASSDGNVFALNAKNGVKLWQYTELDAIRGAPVISNSARGPLLIVASKSGLVRTLNAVTGKEVWHYRTGDWVTGAPAIATVYERPMVFVGSYDNSMYALDLLSGALVWRFHAAAGIHAAPTIITHFAPALVIFSAWDHQLYGVTAQQGEKRFRVYTGRPIWDVVGLEASSWSAPIAAAINDDWMVYIGSYDGTFYALPVQELLARGSTSMPVSFEFWLSFPIALLAVGLFARILTMHYRRSRQR